jgi:5'-nucleotidase
MLKSLLGAAAMLALAAALPAHATTVSITADGTWHAFDVSDVLSSDQGLNWFDIDTGDLLEFKIDIAAGQSVQLAVTDAGFAGDRFEIFDNGVSLGATSVVPADGGGAYKGLDFYGALTTSSFSSAYFYLGEGSHTITGLLLQSALDPVNSTVGGLSAAPVPLPASLLLLFSGGGFISLFARRRKKAALVAPLVVGLALAAGAAQAATTTVKVIALNDFHGNLQSPGIFSGVQSGGADVLATYVTNLKAQNPNNVVVSAGDLIGASPLISGLFHDEPTIEVMNRLGLDFNAVGNHEFDDGFVELKRMQAGGCHPTDPNSCQGGLVGTNVPFEGAKFKFLSANVFVTATGKTVFPAFGVKTVGGVRMGFIGLTFKDTPTVVTPAGVAGLEFRDEVQSINAAVKQLRGLGVQAIVVLIHQGGFQGPAPDNFINNCKSDLVSDANSPIRAVVRGLDDAVDLVVSGHTHTGYNCRLPNRAGRLIPVTQASSFGRVLTDINLTIDTGTGDVVGSTVNNIIVDRTGVTPHAQVASLVSSYDGLVSPLANAVLGTITAAVGSGANAAGESPAGKLIADAQLAATAAPQFGGAVLALMNAGGVRSSGFIAGNSVYPHDVTYGEAFTVQPFANVLVTMTLTGQQIKDVLEQQFASCMGQSANRVMQVSSTLTYSYQFNNACGSRIVDATLNGAAFVANGTVLDPTATYRVTVNNFMATGGDGFTVLTGGTNLLNGAFDLDALVAYLAGFKVPNAPYNPAAFPTRITRLP